MGSRHIPLGYFPPNLKFQFRIAAKKYVEEPYDLLLPEKRLGLEEIEFGSIREQFLKFSKFSRVDEIKEPINIPVLRHRSPSLGYYSAIPRK